MLSSIDTRELISVAASGLCLRGTFHRALDHGSDSRRGFGENKRTGILFLNSGFVPRASGGDAAVYWAEAFANCGYPSFRFDLPGLGDSDGYLPAKRLDFAHLVNTGHYAPSVCTLANHLTERFNLSGVVLVGHCAGAVSAIYAAAASSHFKGVIALDPYFFREETKRAAIRTKISRWVPRNQIARQLSGVYGYFKKLSLLAKGNALPENANIRLLQCWRRLVSAKVPILVLSARGPRPIVGEFDYLAYLKKSSGPRAHITVEFIEGTNHSFADATGKAAVRRHAEQWLSTCFPISVREIPELKKVARVLRREIMLGGIGGTVQIGLGADEPVDGKLYVNSI